MDVAVFLQSIKGQPWYRDQIAHLEMLPPREAVVQSLPDFLHPSLAASLRSLGIQHLYSHQAESISLLRDGKDTVVATPAASGKSLCYHIPVIQAVLEDSSCRALYLYPTKALAQDQYRSLGSLVPAQSRIRYGVYDGDTPPEERVALRRSCHILLSNPDMLHVGVLPNHRAWARFLQGLRYVVVDEAHVYRGVFGSHVAQVLRRLRRLCHRYGSSPRFVLASATIANPQELAQTLVGLPFTAVTQSGSPAGPKAFIFWNPPLENSARHTRRSAAGEAIRLLVELLKMRARSIAFVRTRTLAELVARAVRDALLEIDREVAQRVSPYKGTYLPEERRRIEQELFRGELLSVVATSALELGIDIGGLDATIIVGYPGSVASAWQQAGRSGRRSEESLAVLTGRNDPLDQFLMENPGFFFERPHEQALIGPENPHILGPHLLCAAYEAPLVKADEEFFGPSSRDLVREMEEQGLLHRHQGRWHVSPDLAYPAEGVNIRSATSRTFTVVERDSGRVLETVDEPSVYSQLHPGAVYLHQGETYDVVDLDLKSRAAILVQKDLPYYTRPRELADLRIVAVRQQRRAPGANVYLGEVEVSHTVVGYVKLAHFADQVLGQEPLNLPPYQFRTVAVWWGIFPTASFTT